MWKKGGNLMYLHLGQSVVVPHKNILGIFYLLNNYEVSLHK